MSSTDNVYTNDARTVRVAGGLLRLRDRMVVLGRNPGNPDGAWMITRAILLPDDFTLVLDDCRVELAPGTRDNLIRNAGALGFMRVAPNRNVRVLGRGNATLCGGRSNHFEPAASGDRNGWRAIGILLCAVTDYELAGFTMEETQSWGISQENGCANGWIHDIRFADTNYWSIRRNELGGNAPCHRAERVVPGLRGRLGQGAALRLLHHRNPSSGGWSGGRRLRASRARRIRFRNP